MITNDLLPGKEFSWFDVEKPQSEDFETLSHKFNLPNLLVQDTLRPEHLPKYEYSTEGHFLLLRSYDPQSDLEATTVQELTRKVVFFITPERLISIHRVNLGFMNKVIERCKMKECPTSIQGVLHLITLAIIRSYEEPIENLQDLYDAFEADVLSKKSEKLSFTRIYHFRRQLFVIKRILNQTNEALFRSKVFWSENPSMLQDLKENIDQLYFQLDEISNNFEHLFQLYISLNDQRANEVMKVLTVFSAVLLPLNFIASFYGMNFEFLPGLHSQHALGWLVLIMIFLSVGAVWLFKRKGWFTSPED